MPDCSLRICINCELGNSSKNEQCNRDRAHFETDGLILLERNTVFDFFNISTILRTHYPKIRLPDWWTVLFDAAHSMTAKCANVHIIVDSTLYSHMLWRVFERQKTFWEMLNGMQNWFISNVYFNSSWARMKRRQSLQFVCFVVAVAVVLIGHFLCCIVIVILI